VNQIMKNQGDELAAYQMDAFDESKGVNTRAALAQATKVMQQRNNPQHMEIGVTFINPDDTYIDAGVKIGADTFNEPGVLIKGH
ncbi:bifunctional UDP-N-acetylglucosamine diphosphorylase/glucosamine-1-phosphate N-acetyltransferase GlmU, partial [Lactobacillus sp. CRM56-2]|nr:bifunctional UDP-N-acetylglucosamine diphosphorylase/glucosamine-1-phosphate N-acetyltransferase GlmU [Lactobacillus sp. CRM56-2]